MKRFYALMLTLLVVGMANAQNLVTFQVDMSLEANVDSVSIAGSFQAADANCPGCSDWTPGAIILTDQGNGIYSYTADLPSGTYEYKFLNGTSWGTDESIPNACQVNGNRQVVVSSTTSIPVVCFAQCNPCPTFTDTVQVTFQVNMKRELLLGTVGDTVSVAGSFQGADLNGNAGDWSPGQTVLTDMDGDSIYTYTARIPDGTYAYKYVNGVAWGSEEPVPSACNVNNNREVIVMGDGMPGDDFLTIPLVCFGRCDSVCPPILPPVSVTFRVDATDLFNTTIPDTMWVAGSFQNPAWQKRDIPMVLDLNTSIYSATAVVEAFEFDFKFIHNNVSSPGAQVEEPGPLSNCGSPNGTGGWNRTLDLIGRVGDTILPAFLWNDCNFSDNGRPVALFDTKENIQFSVYPNPFTEFTQVLISDEMGYEFNLRMTDLNGREVLSYENLENMDVVQISSEGLQPGLYLITLEDSNGRRSVKKVAIN